MEVISSTLNEGNPPNARDQLNCHPDNKSTKSGICIETSEVEINLEAIDYKHTRVTLSERNKDLFRK